MNQIAGPGDRRVMRRSIPLLCSCLILGLALPAAASEPPPQPPPRHRASEAMIATGSVALSLGVASQIVGFASWYANATHPSAGKPIDPNLTPAVEIGIGLVFATIGSTFIGVGVKQHVRWKASLIDGSARLQLRPVIGFGQLGVAGRF